MNFIFFARPCMCSAVAHADMQSDLNDKAISVLIQLSRSSLRGRGSSLHRRRRRLRLHLIRDARLPSPLRHTRSLTHLTDPLPSVRPSVHLPLLHSTPPLPPPPPENILHSPPAPRPKLHSICKCPRQAGGPAGGRGREEEPRKTEQTSVWDSG